MAARVNTKFIALLSLVLVVLVAGLGYFTTRVMLKDPTRNLARGDAAMARGQYADAVDQYTRARSKDPTNPAIILKQVDAIGKTPVTDSRQASQTLGFMRDSLERLTRLAPDNQDYFQKFMDLQLQLITNLGGSMELCNYMLEHAEVFLKNHPDYPIGRKYRGIAQVYRMAALDMVSETRLAVRDDLQAALAKFPGDRDILYHLAQWNLIQASQAERAGGNAQRSLPYKAQVRELVGKLIEAHPEDLECRLDRLMLLTQLGDGQSLQSDLLELEKQIKAQPPDSKKVGMFVALLMQNDQQVLDRGPNLPPVTAGVQRAQAMLEEVLKTRPDDLPLLLKLAQLQREQHALDASQKTLEAAVAVKVAGLPLQAMSYYRTQLRAQVQYAEILLDKTQPLADSAQREPLLAKVQTIIDQIAHMTDVDNADLSKLQGRMAMARQQWAQAAIYFDRASGLRQDQDPQLLFFSAEVRRLSGELGAAATRYRELLDKRPDFMPARLQLLQLLMVMRQYDQAQALLTPLLAADPANAQLLALQGELYARTNQSDQAIATYRKIDLAHNDTAAQYLALVYVNAHQFAQARQLLEPLLEKNAKDMRLVALALAATGGDKDLAHRYIAQARAGGGDAARLDMLEKALDQQKLDLNDFEKVIDNTSDPFAQAQQHYMLDRRLGRMEDADAELAKMAQLKPADPQTVEWRFARALEKKDWDTAKRHADQAGTLNLDLAQGRFYQARLCLAQQDYGQAEQLLRKALSLRTTYSEGWCYLGDAQRLAGEITEALNSYRTALDQLPTNVLALRGMAQTLDMQKQYDQALEQWRKIIAQAPGNGELTGQYLAYEETHGDPARALEVRQRLAQANPQNTDNQRAMAVLLARMGKVAQGRQLMQDLIAREGETTANLATLVSIATVAKDPESARQMLREHMQRLGDKATVEDWVLLANFYLLQNESDNALAAFYKAIAVENPTKRQATRALADVLFDHAMFTDAVAYYQKLYESTPDDTRVAQRYVEALLRTHNLDLAQTTLDELAKNHKPTAIEYVLQGMVADERGQHDRATQALQSAVDLQPTNPNYRCQLAQHLLLLPDGDRQATQELNKALELDKNLPNAHMLLAQIALRRRDVTEAVRELTTVLKVNSGFLEARRQLGDIYERNDMFEPWRSLLEESVRLYPRDTSWLRAQARLALREKNVDLARQRLEQAVAIEASPENLSELCLLHLRQGQPAQVLAVLEPQAALRQRSAVLLALQGRALQELQRQDQAQAAFTAALTQTQSFPAMMIVNDQLGQSLGYLRANQLLEPLSLAASGNQSLWLELAIITNLVADGQYQAALDRAAKSEMRIQPSTPERLNSDRLMALCTHRLGRFDQARILYERVLTADPDSVAALNNLAYLLTQDMDKPGEGLHYAQLANRLAPNDPQVLDTLGWAQFKTGQSAEALKTLRRSLDRADLPASNYHLGEVLLAANQKLDAVRYFEKARDMAQAAKENDIAKAAADRLSALKG